MLKKTADSSFPSLDRIREGFGDNPSGVPSEIRAFKDTLVLEKLRAIRRKSNLNNMLSSDEIISAYPRTEVLDAYNSLVGVAPNAMQNNAVARSMLQQYLTQGRVAPSELVPLTTIQKSMVDARENPDATTEWQDNNKSPKRLDIL
jgi:hypothetical protein